MKQPQPKCIICKTRFTPIRSTLEKSCQKQSCRDEWKALVLAKKKDKEDKSGIKKKYTIPKVSENRKREEIIYKSERIKFLMLPENKICPITKHPTTDVHHSKGRIGKLYLDKRYWIALSREGHKFVEENPIWAKENGYSLSRLSNELD